MGAARQGPCMTTKPADATATGCHCHWVPLPIDSTLADASTRSTSQVRASGHSAPGCKHSLTISTAPVLPAK